MPDDTPDTIAILSAHQPVYLPWLGLFHKIEVADLFIIYDDVPYTRYLWYNRNKILGPNGPIQLTVPIRRGRPEGMTHAEVLIDHTQNWRQKHWRSIEHAYRMSPHYASYSPALRSIYETEWEHLMELNLAQLRLFNEWLNIRTPIRLASEYPFEGEKAERALNMSVQLGAHALLFGANGREYADVEAFAARGVAALFQDYVHPSYSQHRAGPFHPLMSIIDLVFNHGSESRNILLSGNWTKSDGVRLGHDTLAATGVA
jgi:hypothetical protein